MDTVQIDKAYILNRLEELKGTPAMQEFIYLQGCLKKAQEVKEDVEQVKKE